MPGNALIGAYNANGDIIWSWHIWVTNNVIEKSVISLGGATMMSVNLGAECNSNGSGEANKIYESYGMYYQWGRKDPFVGPKSYNFAGNLDAKLYDSSSYEVYLNYVESTQQQGTLAWATANPTSIIKGSKDNGYDWQYTAHDNELWSADSKSEYDPCPAGWRVADAKVFENLKLNATYDAMSWEELQPLYGIMLTDDDSDYFFTAQGRRNYIDCLLDIVNLNEECPVPWSGYYWTASTDGDNATALYFNLNTDTRSENGFDNNKAMQRANALPIRCIRNF